MSRSDEWEERAVAQLQEKLSAAVSDVLANLHTLRVDPATAVALHLLRNANPVSPLGEDTHTAVRQMVLGCSRTIRAGREFLDQHTQVVMPSTRSSFLMTLVELIGPAPEETSWRDEWIGLNQEVARLRGWQIPSNEQLSGDGKFALETKLRNYKHQVDYKRELGWDEEDAKVHVAPLLTAHYVLFTIYCLLLTPYSLLLTTY